MNREASVDRDRQGYLTLNCSETSRHENCILHAVDHDALMSDETRCDEYPGGFAEGFESFEEDQCRAREGYAAWNLAMLRKVCLSLLKQDTSIKDSLHGKR